MTLYKTLWTAIWQQPLLSVVVLQSCSPADSFFKIKIGYICKFYLRSDRSRHLNHSENKKYQLSNTLVVEASRLCFQPISTVICNSLWQNVILLWQFHYEERGENHREPCPGRWWWEIKHFPLKTLQERAYCSCSMRPSIVMKKSNTWEQHPSSLVLNKRIELQHALQFDGKLYCFRYVYGLTMRSELRSAMCRDRRVY